MYAEAFGLNPSSSKRTWGFQMHEQHNHTAALVGTLAPAQTGKEAYRGLPHRAGARTSTAWAQTRGVGSDTGAGLRHEPGLRHRAWNWTRGKEAWMRLWNLWSGCWGKDSSEERESEWIPGLGFSDRVSGGLFT